MNKQLIPCLYLHSEKAVTGFGQRNLFGDGNVETLAKFYGDNGQMSFWYLTFLPQMQSMTVRSEKSVISVRYLRSR